jgi:hypothetical protein
MVVCPRGSLPLSWGFLAARPVPGTQSVEHGRLTGIAPVRAGRRGGIGFSLLGPSGTGVSTLLHVRCAQGGRGLTTRLQRPGLEPPPPGAVLTARGTNRVGAVPPGGRRTLRVLCRPGALASDYGFVTARGARQVGAAPLTHGRRAGFDVTFLNSGNRRAPVAAQAICHEPVRMRVSTQTTSLERAAAAAERSQHQDGQRPTLAQSYVRCNHTALGQFSVGLSAIELASACDTANPAVDFVGTGPPGAGRQSANQGGGVQIQLANAMVGFREAAANLRRDGRSHVTGGSELSVVDTSNGRRVRIFRQGAGPPLANVNQSIVGPTTPLISARRLIIRDRRADQPLFPGLPRP